MSDFNSTKIRTVVSAIAMIVFGQAAAAQDSQLYDNAANPDAGFLRVIAVRDASAIIAGENFSDLGEGVSPYVTIEEPGTVSVSAAGVDGTAEIAKGSWNSWLVTADGKGVLVTDPLGHSPAQADLTFYNISDKPEVDLYVPAAKRVALEGVGEGSGDWVALKAPLSLDFEARTGDETLAAVSAVALARREGTTLVFSGTNGNYQLVALKASQVN
ncbi:alginate O-acetyltransferase AlgF [Alloyangia pacifica]|nr:alginate O-acetyltransferase AlgF [Alloyangia pacifica]